MIEGLAFLVLWYLCHWEEHDETAGSICHHPRANLYVPPRSDCSDVSSAGDYST
jgi:hypothetical protein